MVTSSIACHSSSFPTQACGSILLLEGGLSVISQHNNYGLKVSHQFTGPFRKIHDTDIAKVAGSYENRQTFINSVVKYLQDYHLDGIDLDWEYPGASDRGGRSQDATNYVTLLAEMREAFDRENPGWEISATIPTSYWYLRGFDVKGMQKYLDYFNLMSYDLHGMWDQNIKFTGPYLEGHTDISQIELGLDLLWRNDIDPSNVVFGFAFYGRSFTMKDSSCSKPDGKCEFSDGGIPGSCTDTAGILSYAEISSRNNSLDVHTSYDPKTTVKYNVYGGTQWISYDDEQSFSDKKRFVSKRCLSGWMVWAIDQDNGEFDALTGLIGEDLFSLQMKSNEDSRSSDVLADAFAAYTGQNCFVTDRCTDGSSHEKNPDQVCPSGYLSVSTAHNPLQATNKERHGDCDEGWYRQICCPKDAMPKSCEWNGAPERSEFGCDGKCGSNQFKLNQDTALDAKGEGQCFTGARFLCCDSAAIFSTCDWTDCQGPLVEEDPTTCPTGTGYKTYRFDKPNGKPWCSDTYISPVPGYPPGSPHKTKFKSGLCCDSDQSFKNCRWTNVLTREELGGDSSSEHIADLICKPRPCPAGSVKIAGALDPPLTGSGANGGVACGSYDVDVGMDPEWSYCCSPPTKYNKNWPVDPKYLWEKYYNDPDKSDVAWKYSDQYQNNDADQDRSSEEDGSDAYGFVMLDGPDGSLDNDFASSQTVVRRSEKIAKTKRSILTSNQTVMDSVFDHAEETFQVYCNYPADSKECKRVFIDGAEDTIISLPPHVGEGPFARIVSMKEADGDFQLPDHHLAHRSLEHLENPVYEVKIDYNFQNIKLKRDDEPVQIRVDYTNLMGYWDEMTDSPASRMKRSVGEQGLSEPEWRSRVQRAVSRDKNVRKREENIKVKTEMDTSDSTPAHNKRWFGVFGDWLSKLVCCALTLLIVSLHILTTNLDNCDKV
jgi:chitinase